MRFKSGDPQSRSLRFELQLYSGSSCNRVLPSLGSKTNPSKPLPLTHPAGRPHGLSSSVHTHLNLISSTHTVGTSWQARTAADEPQRPRLQTAMSSPHDQDTRPIRRAVISDTAQLKSIGAVGGAILPVSLRHPNVEVCHGVKQFLKDIDSLTLINHATGIAIFHGTWRSSEVTVKFVATEGSAQQHLEATVSTELLHPNILQCYAARSMKMTELCKVGPLEPWMEEHVKRATSTRDKVPRLKGVFKHVTKGRTGFAPVVCSPLTFSTAMINDTALLPTQVQTDSGKPQLSGLALPSKPLDPSRVCVRNVGPILDTQLVEPRDHPGFGAELQWACVERVLQPKQGKIITMLVCEYADVRTLQHAIYDGTFQGKTGQPLTARQKLRAAIRTVQEVAMGLHHIHNSHVLHGDIQPANIMLVSSSADMRGFVAKIGNLSRAMVLADYENDQMWKDDVQHKYPYHSADAGPNKVIDVKSTSTYPYAAPEIFQKKTICKLSDIYSLGVLMWELFHETKPYVNWCEGMVASAAAASQRTLPWSAVVPSPLIDLVARCLSLNPSHRPNAAYVACCLSRIDAMVRQTGYGKRVEALTRAPAESSGKLMPQHDAPGESDAEAPRQAGAAAAQTSTQAPPTVYLGQSDPQGRLRQMVPVIPEDPRGLPGHNNLTGFHQRSIAYSMVLPSWYVEPQFELTEAAAQDYMPNMVLPLWTNVVF